MAPPLKTEPKFGYFPWWPQDGDDWLHPDDVALARTMIPSQRVFCRDGSEGDYLLLHYGIVTLRAHRTLWQEVPHEGFNIGDCVEVLSRGLRNESRTGVIREMLWNDHHRAIGYLISDNDVPVPDIFTRDDLQHVERV